jgi:hypothetical protein
MDDLVAFLALFALLAFLALFVLVPVALFTHFVPWGRRNQVLFWATLVGAVAGWANYGAQVAQGAGLGGWLSPALFTSVAGVLALVTWRRSRA